MEGAEHLPSAIHFIRITVMNRQYLRLPPLWVCETLVIWDHLKWCAGPVADSEPPLTILRRLEAYIGTVDCDAFRGLRYWYCHGSTSHEEQESLKCHKFISMFLLYVCRLQKWVILVV